MVSEAAGVSAAWTFQMSASDLGPMFVDRLKTRGNSLSPFVEELAGYSPRSNPGSNELDEIIKRPEFSAVASVLTQCDFRILHRTGGGSVPLSFFGAYLNRSASHDLTVAVSPSFEGSYLVQVFPTIDSYLDWWIDAVASDVDAPSPNYLPPPTPLESLVYVLHAVDCFRRASYHSLLSYSPTEEPEIRSAEFVQTMTQSMESKDLRWLLPAFIFLCPGLDALSFNPRPEHLDVLAEHDFLIPAKRPQSEEDIFYFGEAGKTMGVEFYRTFMMALGLEIKLLTPAGEKVVGRSFLAPTALANHFIRIEADPSGNCVVNHQAMSSNELRFKLGEMIRSALMPVGQPTFCSSCGSKVNPGNRFCPDCGAALQRA